MSVNLVRAILIVTTLVSALPATAGAQPLAFITSASTPSTVKVIDLRDNSIVSSIPISATPTWSFTAYPYGVTLSPDETRLYVANYGADALTVIDTTTHTEIATVRVGRIPIGVVASPDGRRVFVACHDGTLWTIDATTFTVVASLFVKGGFNSLDGVALNQDGSKLYTTDYAFGGNGTTVYVVDTASNRVIKQLTVDFGPLAAESSADGRFVYVAHYGLEPGGLGQGNTVTVISTATDTVERRIKVGTGPNDLALSPDGKRLYTANATQGTVSVVDLDTDATLATIPVSGATGIDVTSDGARIVVTSATSHRVTIIDTATFSVLDVIQGITTPLSMGRFITTGSIVRPDTVAPVVTVPVDMIVEATGRDGAAVTFAASAADDVDGPLAVSCTHQSGATFALGETTVTCSATDAAGNTGSSSFTIAVVDTTAPVISGITPSQSVLWAPNHKMRAITFSVSAADAVSAASCSVVSVTSNEPVNGLGDGDTGPDWEITGALAVNLRAERSGNGSGRIYTVTVSCSDAAGNASSANATVSVPRDRR